jgi:hypothetical protein
MRGIALWGSLPKWAVLQSDSFPPPSADSGNVMTKSFDYHSLRAHPAHCRFPPNASKAAPQGCLSLAGLSYWPYCSNFTSTPFAPVMLAGTDAENPTCGAQELNVVDVRKGSKADLAECAGCVRFTPESRHSHG